VGMLVSSNPVALLGVSEIFPSELVTELGLKLLSIVITPAELAYAAMGATALICEIVLAVRAYALKTFVSMLCVVIGEPSIPKTPKLSVSSVTADPPALLVKRRKLWASAILELNSEPT